jgi:hypothetical protein
MRLQSKSVKVGNKIVHYKETVEYEHPVIWPDSRRRVHCHTAKLEDNNCPRALVNLKKLTF